MKKLVKLSSDLSGLLPGELVERTVTQQLFPSIAKDRVITQKIEAAAQQVPTQHRLYNADARRMTFLADESVHLALTSPPYWTLKEYDGVHGQLGDVEDYEGFLTELDRVWSSCFAALVPGGRLICVVGDVCLSRRRNAGVHEVVPLHASIQERCRRIGFTNLAPIIWHKIANAAFESGGKAGGFLGKPYEPNAVIKNDIEFVLMLRKPGGYRTPTVPERLLSVIPEALHKAWFQQVWTGLAGASTKDHPAPYPLELAERLVRMFSFVGDTVLDPFLGTGTTCLAAAKWGRNSIGVEISAEYAELAHRRFERGVGGLFGVTTVEYIPGGSRESSFACGSGF